MKGFTRSKSFRIGSIFVACLLLCISFVPLFFKPVEEAKADTVTVSYTFRGSDIFIPFGFNYLTENHKYSHPATDEICIMNFKPVLSNRATITVQGSGVVIPNCPSSFYSACYFYGNRWNVFATYYYLTVNGNLFEEASSETGYCLYAYNLNSNGAPVNIQSIGDVGPTTIIRYTQFFSTETSIADITDVVGPRVDTYIQYGFSSDVVKVRLFGEAVYPADYGSNNVMYRNHLLYTDTKGYTCDIVFTSYVYKGATNSNNYIDVNRDDLIFDDRTYFFTTSFSDDESYQLGLAEGEKNKEIYGDNRVEQALRDWEASISSRLLQARNEGIAEGKQIGYQEGVGTDFGLERFLTSALSALDVPIFGKFSIGQLFALIVGVSLVFIILKIFAGG